MHAIFLLAYAARLSPRRDMGEWLEAARDQSVYLSKAADFNEPAAIMLKHRWAWIEGRARVDEGIARLSMTADRETLLAIAKRLLREEPPSWLLTAVTPSGVEREYIPETDLADLVWLEPELDQVLLEACHAVRCVRDDSRLKRIGDAAELYLMQAFRHAGLRPLHVALWSDAAGYDIKLPGPPIDRIEVKAASAATRGTFKLTRNEFEKCKSFGTEWRVVQVVFTNAAFVDETLTNDHVLAVYGITGEVVANLAPEDSDAFKWIDTAQFKPPPDAWSQVVITPDPSFSAPGFGA